MADPKLPFLPGYRVETQPKANHHLTHQFDVKNGTRIDNGPIRVGAGGGDFGNSLQYQTTTGKFSNQAQATFNKSLSLGATSAQPPWVEFDRKVLRFYAYFKEAVFSSPVENYRVRKCVLYYYLEDDSVHIAEPKVENSGIPQGVFIKRHRIPSGNQGFVSLPDMYIGNELTLYGRTFRLVDCDDFTRSYFAQNDIDLGEAEEVPLDPFTKKNTVRVGTHKKLMHPMKEFMEASLGKQMGVEIDATQKFLKNDGKVLRFFCSWNDTKMYGEKRPFVLHYFLADDTVEVLEVRRANSGRDPFPALLSRSKLPKAYTEISPDVSRIGSNTSGPVDYYKAKDIKIGITVQVYGRDLLVCGCDDFTQSYYMRNFDMQASDFEPVDVSEPLPPAPVQEPPAHNGFGTEEDSMGSVLALVPKPPRKDFKKAMDNDGLNLRYLAKLVDADTTDRDRLFIITYFCADDTVSIFEKFMRNSGHCAGSWLEQCKVKNPAGGYYTAIDFQPGNQLTLNYHKFEVVEADEFTQKYITAHPEIFSR